MCMLLCGCAKTAESHATTVPGESQATVTSADEVSLATTSETEISSLPVSSDEQTVLITKTTTGRTTTVSVSESTKTTTTTGSATTVSASGSTKTTVTTTTTKKPTTTTATKKTTTTTTKKPTTTTTTTTKKPTTTTTKPANLYPVGDLSWRSHPQDFKLIALTYDDAPSSRYTAMGDIIRILRSYGGSGTFFVRGDSIGGSSGYDILKTAVDNGFELGNHTYSHPNLTQGLSRNDITHEITKVNQQLKQGVGVTPKFLRPGFLAVNDDVYAVAKQLGMPIIGCASAPDTVSGYTAQTIYQDVITKAKDGDIFLFHVQRTESIDALDNICETLYQQNYRFVKLSEMYAFKGITPPYYKKIANVLS